MRIYTIIILSLFLGVAAAQPAATPAGGVPLSPGQIETLQQDITSYMEEVEEITAQISDNNAPQLKQLRRELQAIDARWQTFNAMEQNDIASTPALMELLSQYKQLYLATDDSITAELARCDAQASFVKASAFINRCRSSYDNLLHQALEYSLVQQTATQLGNVKAQEQLLMQQVTAQYTIAVNAANAVPSLKGQMSSLEEKYVEIQEMSKTIQATAYKSFIERIKDYLLSFAAVAIIIMFLTMVVQRIAAIKKAREMAKKYGDMLNGQYNDIPTI